MGAMLSKSGFSPPGYSRERACPGTASAGTCLTHDSFTFRFRCIFFHTLENNADTYVYAEIFIRNKSLILPQGGWGT